MKLSITTFFQLIRRDLLVFRYEFFNKLIDTITLLFTNLVIFGYVMTSLGLAQGYSSFLLVGAIAGFGFFEIIGRASMMIADITGDRSISYTLTLPLPTWVIFCYIAVAWGICSGILTICLFPIGKLILFNQFHFTYFSFLRFIPIFIVSNLFFGFFALWVASIIKEVSQINSIWFRIVNPFFMFGAYFYSWRDLYAVSPFFGKLNLINPFLYIMEGMRSAVLGPENYLPIWLSFIMLAFYTSLFGWHGIKRLRKRLDTV